MKELLECIGGGIALGIAVVAGLAAAEYCTRHRQPMTELECRMTFVERGLRLETSYESHGVQTYRVYKGDKLAGLAARKGDCWNYGKTDGEWRHEGPRAPISDAALWIEHWVKYGK
jgi:hypothetical protein